MIRSGGFHSFFAFVFTGAAALNAAPASAGYDQPPKPLLDVLHAPSPPAPFVNSQGSKILLVSPLQYPAMSRVAEPFLRLGGVRVEPRNRSRHDTPAGYGIRACMHDFTLVDVATSKETKVAFPQGLCPAAPSWSVDGTQFAFENAAADSVELWIGDANTGEIHRIDGVRLNPMFDDAVQWLGGAKSLLVKLVPEGQGAPPADSGVPAGPDIQEAIGEKGESSTYEARDTLSGKHDEDLFDYYGASQLAVVDAANGSVRRVGKAALYTGVSVAPDGNHVLYQAIKRPYSYAVTYERFPHDVGVLDLAHDKVQVIASLPLADRVPVHGEPLGPRDFDWRANEPATLVWAEALDNGDWKVKVPARDKVMMLKAPFTAKPAEILRTEQRFVGFAWGAAPSLAFMMEIDANRHWRKTSIVDVDAPKQKPRVLWDMSSDERYKNPGSFAFRRLPNGAYVVRQDGDDVYLRGQGASPQGDRPFLDRLNLKTLTSERLFRSDASAFDRFLAFGAAPGQFMTWHESITDPPNAFMRTLGEKSANAAEGEAAFASTAAPVTHVPDPTPELRKIKKQLVKYKRADGVDLSFTLYTPPDYKEGTKLPAVLYAYPLDYADSKQAGQVSGSQQTFTRLPPYRLLLLAGYAVIDNAAFPVVGDPKTAYDTYLEQLVADAKAAVDKAVELGVVDRERIGVTGHSHGALMTVNLLAHSDLFRAGVATSGSYNKTLTPFGFQNERRSIWDAQKVYLDVSPFFYADKLKLPLLLVHGEDDANPGTEPVQARKLYQAVRGNGGTTRLVMLPHEPHWYTAMESNEQLVAEMLKWFDRYVKDAKPREKPAAAH
ncbi:MAG: S9 family peptidase [Rudaea sp.]|uniref:S9 family peptidase n=1 Tax=unclassified Rudaea TaxID=2627037 RepID=UPI0010F9847C|nr:MULTISPECIES: prolyl oligopeptidase family serine peptidase [unclassified Rudaea]MBN8884520.1 S9 family peptidase [Rudaea sp.]MBR0347765.1 S9 family peptidase [Rudaea sp.]